MKKNIPLCPGIPSVENHYTKIPNIFFDKFMRELPPAIFTTLLCVARHLYGFHKIFDQIAESQFTRATGLSLNTIRNALNILESHEYIFRHKLNEGRGRKTYFFLNDPEGRSMFRNLKNGWITLSDALKRNSRLSSGYTKNGANFDPINGAKSDPIISNNGSKSDHTKDVHAEKKEKKKSPAAGKHPSNRQIQKTDAAERVRELNLAEKRRRMRSSGQPMRLRDVLLNLPIGQEEN